MEDLLKKLGRWHIPALVFCFCCGFPSSQFIMILTFLAPKQDHWCARPDTHSNWTVQQWKNVSIPLEASEAGQMGHSQCKMYSLDYVSPFQEYNSSLSEQPLNVTVPCNKWEFDTSVYRDTVLSEWNLVCDDRWLLAMSQSIVMTGFMIGNFVFSHISDWFGRRLALIVCTVVSGGASVGIVFSDSFIVYNIFRFIASLGHGGIQNVSYTMGIECVAPGRRAFVSMLQMIGWISGCMCLPGLAYLLPGWKELHLAISVSFPFMLLAGYLMDESPRWLLACKRYDEAEKVMLNVVRLNKVEVVRDIKKIVLETKDKVEQDILQGKSTVIDIFKNGRMAITTLSVYFVFASCCLIYYNLMYLIVDFGGNPHLNFFLVSLLEFPVMIISMFLINYVRRRITYFILYIPTGLICLGIILVPAEYYWVQLALVTVGKLAVHCIFTTICVHITECYPTVVRAVALGSSLTASRIGPIISPFFKELGRATYYWVPSTIDVTLCVLCLLLALSLPETFNKALPDTMKETLDRRKKSKSKTPLSPDAEGEYVGEELLPKV